MTSPPMIPVLVVDDDPFVRRGLTDIFAASPDIRVVAEADDGDQVPDAVAAHHPAVVLMDLKMRRTGGIEAITALGTRSYPPRIIAMTALDVDDLVVAAVRAGAHGFIRKDESPATFGLAVRAVASGSTLFSEQSLREILGARIGMGSRPDAAPHVATLSARERDVLCRLATGATNAVIAADIFVSETTVKSHVSSIFTKLGVTTRVEAALDALRAGLVP